MSALASDLTKAVVFLLSGRYVLIGPFSIFFEHSFGLALSLAIGLIVRSPKRQAEGKALCTLFCERIWKELV
jgi:hypothetical protein